MLKFEWNALRVGDAVLVHDARGRRSGCGRRRRHRRHEPNQARRQRSWDTRRVIGSA